MTYIISLASLPKRYKILPNVIESMLKQTSPPKKIYIYISKRDNLPPHKKGTLAHSKIIYKKVDDIGPFTKLYYTLQDPTISPDERVLVTDDDAVKAKSWAKVLLSKMNKKKVTSFSKIIHGGYGFAIYKGVFNSKKIKNLFFQIPKMSRFIDDDFLTFYCVLNAIKIHKIDKIPDLNQTKCLPKIPQNGLVHEKGKKKRENLRLEFQKYIHKKYKLYFSLSFKKIDSRNYSNKRQKTIGLHKKTFG